MDWPESFQINAWAGAEAANSSDVTDETKSRLLARGIVGEALDLGPQPAKPQDWAHPEVGWGLVMADDDKESAADKAAGKDAPEPLRQLLAARGDAPVLRYRKELEPKGQLRRYYRDGAHQDIMLSALGFGTARARIPRYLLIWGTPEVIPWSMQYQLQTARYVGRIDLTGEALKRYVRALIDDWNDGPLQAKNTTVWAADHGPADITRLMRNAVAAPLHKKFADDNDPAYRDGATYLTAAAATHDKLIADLAARQPSLVATTSHGATGPLDDVPLMRSRLGLPVDHQHRALDPGTLLAQWQPAGAVWFAQACCSAGSSAETAYDGLVKAGSTVDRILKGVAACGAMTAPLPRALLGAERPLRAFVGHVEPTFDWTLRHPDTRQFLSEPLIRAFYEGLYTGLPVGMALEACRIAASSLLGTYQLAVDDLKATREGAGGVLAIELMAKDWRSLVLLGDPTCALRGVA